MKDSKEIAKRLLGNAEARVLTAEERQLLQNQLEYHRYLGVLPSQIGQEPRPRKGQTDTAEDGGQSGRDGGGRGAGADGPADDSAGLEEEGLAGIGRKSAKPGKRRKGRVCKRLGVKTQTGSYRQC